MKKIATIGLLLTILLSISACGADREQHFTVTEIDAYDFAEPLSQFVLIGLQPSVLIDGEAYIYEDAGWNKIYEGKKITEIYAGEAFCALTEDGEIYVADDALAEYESYPLGAAGVYYNAEKMLEYSSGSKIEHLSANILNDCIIAASVDGGIKVYVNGMERGIAEPIRVADMSGKYLLSEEGDVYMVSYPDSFERVRVKRVSDDKFVSISACPTANRCIGIKHDGSTEVWSDVEGELASDFQDIDKISMGFHYCIALSEDGKVCFSAYDEELEVEIRAYLEKIDDNVVNVACAYNRIAIMFEDYSICMIDF